MNSCVILQLETKSYNTTIHKEKDMKVKRKQRIWNDV